MVLDTDTLYSDSAVALFFGLDPRETTRGLPIAKYIARMHPDERETIARLISVAVQSGLPYHAEYRGADTKGHFCWVMASGRWF